MKSKIFRTHLRRMITSRGLYFSIVVYCLLMMLTSMNVDRMLTGRNSMALLIYSIDMSGFGMFLTTAVPAMAYVLTYIDDYDTRLLYVWCVRAGTERYAVSYYLTAVLGGFCTSILGMALFTAINYLRGVPLITDFPGTISYEALYYESRGLYVAVILLEYALGCAAMAGVAAACSSITHRKMVALIIPMLFKYIFDIFPVHPLLSPLQLTRVSNYAVPMPTFVSKLLAFFVYTVISGLITVTQIRRSVNNA
jgi:hypothetical protein